MIIFVLCLSKGKTWMQLRKLRSTSCTIPWGPHIKYEEVNKRRTKQSVSAILYSELLAGLFRAPTLFPI